MQINMNKILLLAFVFFLASCSLGSLNPKGNDKITAFYDKADSDFYDLGERVSKLTTDKQLLEYIKYFRAYFAVYSRDSLKLTAEILNSDEYSAQQKEKLLIVLEERQKALHNAFIDRLDFLINECLGLATKWPI